MDKLTAKIKKFPFQTGIVIGVLACLLLFGLVHLISSGPADLSAVQDVIREDYLRMSISDYSVDRDDAKAVWRYKQLGPKADETLVLMRRDSSIRPNDLLAFAESVGKTDVFSGESVNPAQAEVPNKPEGEAESGKVRKGFSPFAIVLFVILFLLIAAAAVLRFWSERKVKEKKRRRESVQPSVSEDVVVRMVEPEADLTPVMDTDDGASQDFDRMIQRVSYKEQKEAGKTSVQIPLWKDDVEPEGPGIISELTGSEEPAEPEQPGDPSPVEEASEESPDVQDVTTAEEQMSVPDEAVSEEENTLPEETEEPEPETVQEKDDTEPQSSGLKTDTVSIPVLGKITSQEPEPSPKETAPNADPDDTVLTHFSAVYHLGDDLFDETFSIESEGVFLGECGIGIGETLNNTDPKAVTAFEVWLFDRSDIHTPTHYLLSDFAMTNEGIVERIQQKGNYDRIRKNGKTTIRTQSMEMELTVTGLSYGTEMAEKNSYFTSVTFEIDIRQADNSAKEEHIVYK